MPVYPVIDELELEIRTGQGIAIIVEGDSYEEDPWFYGQWFNDRAGQLTFFPQNGWAKVIEAVIELRRRVPNVPVYGIIDRDFTADADLEADFATQGILRTQRYTLENYLLDPNCWAGVFAFIFRRQQTGAPEGWDDPAQVQTCVEQAYQDCLVLAAHNWVIKFGNERYPDRASQTRESDRIYREHPEAFDKVDPVDKLRAWGQQLAAGEDFAQLYADKLAELNRGPLAEWQRQVSGKYVLSTLQRRFPRLLGSGQFPLTHYLNEYLRSCPDPPADLVEVVDQITRDVTL